MDIQKEVNPNDYQIGVIIARYQVHELHEAHKEMIDLVCDNHKKIIIFLGISRITDTKRNPLDFATRKAMIQKEYPNIVILPQQDQRYDKPWSESLDAQISIPYGPKKALLYGSRDSFIPHYKGVHKTVELTSNTFVSGTEIRNNISQEILESKDFRAGVIHSAYAQRAVTYSTVDICAYNDDGQILLAKKPQENKWRFVGGFVDRTDVSFEHAAHREFREETGGELGYLRNILSVQVDDWRYKNEDSGIMTTLFLGRHTFGRIEPNDDISELKFIKISKFTNIENIKNYIMEEHQEMMCKLIEEIYTNSLIPNLGKFYKEKIESIDPDIVQPNKFKLIL